MTVSLESPSFYVGEKIKGNITVTHPRSIPLDVDSFSAEGEPFLVEKVREVTIDPNADLLVSIFTFELVPRERGVFAVPEIEVRAGGERGVSFPMTFEVVDREKKDSHLPHSFLRLETIVKGETDLFPGQQTEVGYRFVFVDHLELSEEKLPLLEGKGLKKIGGKRVREWEEGQFSVIEITQILQAEDVGTHTFPPGAIEGRLYRMDRLGQKRYSKRAYRVETDELLLRVLPFQEEGKPKIFGGAVGIYTVKAELSSGGTVRVGDQLTLFFSIQGEGEFETVAPPELCCLQGFSGFFRLSDLPPEVMRLENGKRYTFHLRPLSDQIEEIPSIPFAFFNPARKIYQTVRTEPIPIQVTPLTREGEGFDRESDRKKSGLFLAPPIEVEGLRSIDTGDLQNKWFGGKYTLFALPLGVFVLLIQCRLRSGYEEMRRKKKRLTADQLFEKVLTLPQTPLFFQGLEEVFRLKMEETGESMEEHPEIQFFFAKVEKSRFGSVRDLKLSDVKREAKFLFEGLKK